MEDKVGILGYREGIYETEISMHKMECSRDLHVLHVAFQLSSVSPRDHDIDKGDFTF